MPPIQKNFYREHAEVASMSAEKVNYIREQNNNITVSRVFSDEPLENVPIPNPVETFEQCFADYPDILRKYQQTAISLTTI